MNSIKCPHCQKFFDPGEVAMHEYLEKGKEALEEEKKRFKEEAKLEAKKDFELKQLDSEKEKKEKDERIDKLMTDLLKTNEEVRSLKQKEKEMGLEMQKWKMQEEEKITEKVSREEKEKSALEKKELELRIETMSKKIEELSKSGGSKSQQLQGEALEKQVLEILSTFHDEIIEIEKGVSGADIRQVVKSPKGFSCGTILWECKRTEWSEKKFIEKLKKDQRAESANIAVVVTEDLPKDANGGFINRGDDVWICSLALVLPLAVALRKILLDAAYQRALSANRGEKKEDLYSYITSTGFSQSVKTIVEVYKDMIMEITSEEATFQRKWKLRKAQAEKILMSMADIVGSIQGKIGISALQIKELELLEGGSNDENSEQTLL